MQGLDEFSRRYVELCLRIDSIMGGRPTFVDAYMGPVELRDKIASESKQGLRTLYSESKRLLAGVDKLGYDRNRTGFIEKQLISVNMTLRELMGEPIPYEDKISNYYDVVPEFDSDDIFEEALSELDGLLPGEGSVRDRFIKRVENFQLPNERLNELIGRVVNEARKRTREFVALPEESVEIKLVKGEDFNGYNIYLGNYRSIIEVNTPLLGFNLIPLMCHEAYAGHHVERTMKEKLLYKGRGFGEHAIFVWRSPENLVANGIGNNASMVLFGEEGMQKWLAENIYPDAGIEALDVTTEVKVARAMAKLSGFRAKAAMMLHKEGVPVNKVKSYIEKYLLTSGEQTERVLNRITDPFLHMNIHVYYFGERLVRRYLETGDYRQRFVDLLTEQVYPSLIAERTKNAALFGACERRLGMVQV
jgi:hypothetical protein